MNYPRMLPFITLITIFTQAQTLAQTLSPEERIKQLQAEILSNPKSSEAYNSLGDAYLTLGEGKEALLAYRQAILLNLDKAPVDEMRSFNLLNNAISKFGLYAEAVEIYKDVILIKPDHPIAYASLGNTFAALRRYQEATEAYKQAIRVGPHDSTLYVKLGEAYLALGDEAAALAMYETLKICMSKQMIQD